MFLPTPQDLESQAHLGQAFLPFLTVREVKTKNHCLSTSIKIRQEVSKLLPQLQSQWESVGSEALD